MRVTAKGEYGLRAMVFLAQNGRARPVPLRLIALEEDIPLQFLEQIFLLLRRDELVKSVRGIKGGYLLAREPREIKVGDIVRSLDGPIVPVSCVDEKGQCVRTDMCPARGVWVKLRDRMTEVLDEMTLEDVLTDHAAVLGGNEK